MHRTVCFGYGLLVLMALTGMPAAYGQGSLDDQLRQPVNREAVNQRRDVADQFLRLGERQADQGDYQSALRAWSQAVEIYYEIGDSAAMERGYGNIGSAHAQLGDYTQAETAVRRQLAIARDNQSFSTQIFAWNTLGSLNLQRGAIESATNAYEEALNIAYSVNNFDGIGLSLSNLGLLAAGRGDYAAAIDYYEVAGNYRVRAGNLVGRANTSNNLGAAYLAQGQSGKAIGAYRLALAYGRDSRDMESQLQAIDGLIDVYSEERNWDRVRSYLDERIALTLNSDNDWGRLITLKRLGEFYEATGDLDSAQQEYQRAYTLARDLDYTSLEVELFNRLLSFQDRQGSSN